MQGYGGNAVISVDYGMTSKPLDQWEFLSDRCPALRTRSAGKRDAASPIRDRRLPAPSLDPLVSICGNGVEAIAGGSIGPAVSRPRVESVPGIGFPTPSSKARSPSRPWKLETSPNPQANTVSSPELPRSPSARNGRYSHEREFRPTVRGRPPVLSVDTVPAGFAVSVADPAGIDSQ